jgi:hypothetical protein
VLLHEGVRRVLGSNEARRVGDALQISLTKLPLGKYTLRVEAEDQDGQAAESLLFPEDKGNKADLETDLAVASPPLPCSEEAAERNDLDDQRSRDAETQFTQGHAVWRGRSAESCSGV